MAGFRGTCLGAALGLLAALPSTAQQIDLYGVTQATLEWSPASGPVQGYYVIVARNGGTPALQGVAAGTRATVDSSYGDRVSVQVAGFDAAGIAGPVSPASSTIVFNPPPSSPPPPAAPDPAPAPAPEPAPDPAPAPQPAPAPGDGSGAPGDGVAAARFDFTGEGASDVLLHDPRSGALTLWAMQAMKIVKRTGLAQLPSPWRLDEPGDFDGDGTIDLLWRNARTGQLAVWLIHDGAVASGANLDAGTTLTRYWSIAARGDLDGDGIDDLVLARPERGVVDLLLMQGGKVASKLSRNAPSDRWRVIAAPDADGDGTAELLWENVDSHALSLEWMAQPGKAVALVAQPGDWRVLGMGDLDGDGDDDLLAMERTTRLVKGWLLDGVRVATTSWSAEVADRLWMYRGMGDFNGDGRADVFWFHTQSDVVGLWLSKPGGIDTAILDEVTRGTKPVGDQGD